MTQQGKLGSSPSHSAGPRLWRGFILGLVLLPPNTLWIFHLEQIGGHGPFVSTISLFSNVVFILVFVALANLALRRLRPSLALNRPELVIVYVMLTISTSIMSHDMLQVLISVMTTGYWYATPQNRWDQMLDGTTPSWLLISDQDVLYGYKYGASSAWGYGANWFGSETSNRLQSWIENPEPANLIAPFAMAGGFAISALLGAARARFVGWPLDPVAYALSASWSIHLVWTPMFIAWLIKGAVLRYGGLRFYRRVLPFFFGLIMGESVVGCSWSLIGIVFRVPSYNFFGP